MTRVRSVLAIVAIVLGCVLAPLSVLAVWAVNEISNTDRYVENVTPLASDPDVQNAVATRTATELADRLDVQHLVGEAVQGLESRGLPPAAGSALEGLAAPLTGRLEDYIKQAALKVVQSDAFKTFWAEANRTAHTQLVRLLSGDKSGALQTSGDAVTIDLGPIVEQVKERLVADGVGVASKIPAVHATYTIMQSKDLPKAQRAYSAAKTLRWVLPILALVLLAGGVFLAHSRRRALLGVGLGLAAGMLLLAAALAIARAGYLDQVRQNDLNTSAAGAVFDTLIRFLKAGLRTILLVGLVLAAAAYLTGPSAAAVAVRTRAAGLIRSGGDKAGIDTGRFGAWVYEHRAPLRIGTVAVAAVVFVFWDRPTAMVVVLLVVAVLVVLLLIQLFARPLSSSHGGDGGGPAPHPS